MNGRHFISGEDLLATVRLAVPLVIAELGWMLMGIANVIVRVLCDVAQSPQFDFDNMGSIHTESDDIMRLARWNEQPLAAPIELL